MPYFFRRLGETFITEFLLSIPFAIVFFILQKSNINVYSKPMIILYAIPAIINIIITIYYLRSYYFGIRNYLTYAETNILTYFIFVLLNVSIFKLSLTFEPLKVIYHLLYLPYIIFIPLKLTEMQSLIAYNMLVFLVILFAPAEMVWTMRSRSYRDGV